MIRGQRLSFSKVLHRAASAACLRPCRLPGIDAMARVHDNVGGWRSLRFALLLICVPCSPTVITHQLSPRRFMVQQNSDPKYVGSCAVFISSWDELDPTCKKELHATPGKQFQIRNFAVLRNHAPTRTHSSSNHCPCSLYLLFSRLISHPLQSPHKHDPTGALRSHSPSTRYVRLQKSLSRYKDHDPAG